jgi:nitrile hydratase accessory protein
MTRLTTPVPGTIASLPPLRRDEDGPVFAEPWQAQAFALAVKLSEQGHFTWNEWATALADELQDGVRRGEPDDGSRYYEHWLAALEKLVAEKGLTDSAALLTRKQAWVSAYRSNPHGQPVELPSSSGISEFLMLLAGGGIVAALYWFMRGEDASALSEGAVVSAGFGALLGMRHALEPDHLAAISPLMTGNRSSAQAAWLGACWGIGHTLTLLVAGGLLMVLKLEMPTVVAQGFELAVIVMLVGFGVRAMH